MVRAFPTPTNVNQHVLLALGSDCTGRYDVEMGHSHVLQVYLCETS